MKTCNMKIEVSDTKTYQQIPQLTQTIPTTTNKYKLETEVENTTTIHLHIPPKRKRKKRRVQKLTN